MTVFAFVLVLIIMIPVLAIVIDSPVGQALARRISSGSEGDADVSSRIEAMEADVRYLNETVETLRQESEFLHSLIEGRSANPPRLETGTEKPEPGTGD